MGWSLCLALLHSLSHSLTVKHLPDLKEKKALDSPFKPTEQSFNNRVENYFQKTLHSKLTMLKMFPSECPIETNPKRTANRTVNINMYAQLEFG